MREITQGIAEFGLPGASLPKECGGMGLSAVTEAMLFEELCAVSVEVAFCVMSNMVMATVLAELPESRADLRNRYLPGLLSGCRSGGFCISGADGSAGVTVCDPQAVGGMKGFVLTGEQRRVFNGHYSDFLIVRVRTDAGAWCHLLVDREKHGYRSQVVGKAGLNDESTVDVTFKDMRLPSSYVIWNEEDGPRHWTGLQERVHAAAGMLSVGLMRAALEPSVAAAQQQSGTDQPAAVHPVVAVKFAEMAMRLDAARLMCFRAYSMMETGIPSQVQAFMVQCFATEMAVRTCQDAVQLRSGLGTVRATDVERLVREAIALPIPDGATDIHELMSAQECTRFGTPSRFLRAQVD